MKARLVPIQRYARIAKASCSGRTGRGASGFSFFMKRLFGDLPIPAP
jgi:hypothetical protein